ncbi:MAG TPA: hypothetical protein VFV99_17465 [Kofleriaceae bacterium]|nr:hypothetical protein [Kofleriaceae bacterium]
MRTAVVLCVLVAACRKESEPRTDWSQTALDTTIESTVKDVPFTLSLPRSWKFSASHERKEVDPEQLTKEWRPDLKDFYDEPSVTVAYAGAPAKTLDAFVKETLLDPTKDVIEKEARTADGYVIAYHTPGKGVVRVEMLKTKGDVSLYCRGSQARGGGVPSPLATLAWLEKVCDSLTLL